MCVSAAPSTTAPTAQPQRGAPRQALGAQPTCQILPPSFPGFRRYCPYTLHPGATAIWNGPDLERARRLGRRLGHERHTGHRLGSHNQKAEGPFAAALMHSFGYRTRLKQVATGVYYDSAKGPGNPRLRVQAGAFSWQADYPAASNYINSFSCAAGGGRQLLPVLRPRIEARIQRALTLQTTESYRANQLWERIDREIVDQARDRSRSLTAQANGIRLEESRQLPVQPAMGHPARPALGEVTLVGRSEQIVKRAVTFRSTAARSRTVSKRQHQGASRARTGDLLGAITPHRRSLRLMRLVQAV